MSIYIWGESNIPTNWLLAYYPLVEDANDHKADLWVTWTTYNWAWEGTANYWTVWWKTAALFSRGSNRINTGLTTSSLPISICARFYHTTTNDWETIIWNPTWNNTNWFAIRYAWGSIRINNGSWADRDSTTSATSNVWHSVVMTIQSWTTIVYLDWNQVSTFSNWSGWWSTFYIASFWAFTTYWFNWYIWDVCIYDRVLSADEVMDYHMFTRWDSPTETPWEVNENTMIYMPMDWDAENKVDWTLWTWSWTETYYTLPNWIDVAHSNSSHYLLTPTVANSTPLTVSCWIYRNSGDLIVRADSNSWTRSFPQIWIWNNIWGVRFHYIWTWYWWEVAIENWWHNIIWVFWTNWIVWYIDWHKICESSFNSYLWRTQQRWIWYDQAMRNVPWDWYYSNLIIESKEWSADEALSYYYQTRNDYVDDPWYPVKEYEVQNIYIGHLEWYQPNENTIIYFPLTDDTQDHSGKSVTVSTTGNPTITTLDWVKCCYFNWSSTIDTNATNNDFNVTWSAWVYQTASWSMFLWNQPCWIAQWTSLQIQSNRFYLYVYNGSSWYYAAVDWIYTWWWHHFLVSNKKIYIDWEYKTTFWYNISIWWNQPINLWWHNANSSCTRSKITWYMWETFIESWEWTAEQVARYYNATKNNYTTSNSSVVVDPWIAI